MVQEIGWKSGGDGGGFFSYGYDDLKVSALRYGSDPDFSAGNYWSL